MGLDRTAQGGRGGDQAHLPHARKAHVEGAGDRGGGEGQHVHVLAQRLDLLLLIHPEALLLVHHQQPQLLEGRALAQQLVGAHHHIDGAVLQALQDRLALRGGAEAVEQGHLEGVGGVAIAQGAPVLLGQHRGGGQQGALAAGGDGLEDGPDRHLGLAEAHIAAHQPVHGLVPLHVAFHLHDRLLLVGGGLVGEGILQFALPGSIGGEGESRRLVALGVELHQVDRHLSHGLAGPFLGLAPGRAAHAVEFRWRVPTGPVAPQAAQLVGGHPQQAIGILHRQVVAGFTADGQLLQLQEAADAVVAVHHEIAGAHLVGIHRAAGGLAAPAHVARGGEAVLAEEFPVGEQHQLPGRQFQTLQLGGAPGFQRHRRVLFDQPLDGGEIGRVGNEAADTVVFLQQGHRPGGLGREEPHPGLLPLETPDQPGQLAELVGVGRYRPAGQVEVVGMVIALMQLRQVEAGEGFGWRPTASRGGQVQQGGQNGGGGLLPEAEAAITSL